MIRIIFDNGEIADCEHIEKVYVEEFEMDKVTVVGKLEDETNGKSNSGTGECDTNIETENAIG